MTTTIDVIAKAIAFEMLHRLHIADDGQADEIANTVVRRLGDGGFVIVPREPTEAMLAAGVTESDDTPSNYAPDLEIKLVYKAMINAALKERAK